MSEDTPSAEELAKASEEEARTAVARSNSRRMKRFEADPEFLPMLFVKGNAFEILQGVPVGARFCGYVVDASRNILVFFIQHDSYEEVEEGKSVPLAQMEFRKLIIQTEPESNLVGINGQKIQQPN